MLTFLSPFITTQNIYFTNVALNEAENGSEFTKLFFSRKFRKMSGVDYFVDL